MRLLILALALVPVVRFGPRYITLSADLVAGRAHSWTDLTLSQDSQDVARTLAGHKGTLFVWGYRPDIYALTRMPAATQFLDSQPISGVIADRHLKDSRVSAPEWAMRFKGTVEQAKPDFIVDGLGLLNPALAIPRTMIEHYQVIANTGRSIVYQRTQ